MRVHTCWGRGCVPGQPWGWLPGLAQMGAPCAVGPGGGAAAQESAPPVFLDLPGGAVQRGDQGAQDRAAEWPVRRLLPGLLCVQSVLWLQRL